MKAKVMGAVALTATSLLVTVATSSVSDPASSGRHRRCCYAGPGGEDLCHSPEACVVVADDRISSPDLTQCRVTRDTKRSKTRDDDLACLKQGVDSSQVTKIDKEMTGKLPYSLRPYAAHGKHNGGYFPQIPGIDVVLDYSKSWSAAQFRILNLKYCRPDAAVSELPELCSPRCVHISKKDDTHTGNASLSYDCEMGFIPNNKSSHVVDTSGDMYQFDVCMNETVGGRVTCHSFLFVMPQVEGIFHSKALPLVDKVYLDTKKEIVLYLDDNLLQSEYNMSVGVYYQLGHDAGTDRDWKVVNEVPVRFRRRINSISIERGDADLQPGIYMVKLGDQLLVKFSHISTSSSLYVTVFLVVITCALLVAAGAIVMLLHRRYVFFRRSLRVCPTRLLDSGRITGKNLVIITNVDNRQHVDFVFAFNAYLKTYCAVSKVYFALDEETGIVKHPQHDPWLWAQQVAETELQRADGTNTFLVFIGSPPQDMGVQTYKDLPNNQAFLSAKFLRKMEEEKRLAIVMLPYSDLETLPTLVPAHLRSNPYRLPKEMNGFLCQLLEVKKRRLFSCLPWPSVRPQVIPHDLSLTKDGGSLLQMINSLSSLVNLHKSEQAKKGIGAGDTMLTNASDNSEQKTTLLSPRTKQPNKSSSPSSEEKCHRQEEPFHVEVERCIFSLRSDDALKRDHRIDPEFQ